MSISQELERLYQEVVLDHNRYPRNWGELPDATHKAHGLNPLCGDELFLYLKIEKTEREERIVDVKFSGHGCAISRASASMLTEAIKGKTTQQAKGLFEKVHRLLTLEIGQQVPAELTEGLGELVALAGVHAFPSRVKCASLPWHTLISALENKKEPVSTE